MSDIIRKARAQYGDAYDKMCADAGMVKAEYVAGGGDPADVYSPERMEELARGGGDSLEALPPELRPDGSVAGPYLPTEMALSEGMIQPEAMPSVLQALMDGVETVSSGVDRDGNGFAIGRHHKGQVVKVKA